MSERVEHSAVVKVQLTVEVYANSSWGGDCTIQQAYDQGERSAVEKLRSVLQQHRDIRIVGDPVVTAVLSTRPKR